MKQLAALVRKRLDTLAISNVRPQLSHQWREILHEEAAAIEQVIEHFPEDFVWRYHNEPRFHAFVERIAFETLEQYKQSVEHRGDGEEHR